ncbi:hypothetical protein CSC17_5108 [Klebsiella oxytoca]|nr:hypothetical protein CSC17_5108 [Klebsiella oxytoca]
MANFVDRSHDPQSLSLSGGAKCVVQANGWGGRLYEGEPVD